jgi:ABC-type glycerol-3-phosphate transport system substrate-binding protein
MKRVACLISALLLIPAVIFANGAKEPTTQSPGSQKVIIEYISGTILETPEGTFEQSVIDSFNAAHPEIEVRPIGVASNDQIKKMIALATTGDLPDFFLVNDATVPAILDMGVCLPVSEVMSAEFMAQFAKPFLNLYSGDDGVNYGVPWFACPPGVLYRKDIFEANNIKVPSTWDELVETAKALTKDGNYGITLVGTKNSSGGSRFQHVERNVGIDEFYKDANGKWQTDIGSPNYIKALKMFTDLDLLYGVVPPGVVETGYPEAVGLFASGRAAMLITGSNAIGAITKQVPALKGKLGSIPVPSINRYVAAPNGSGFMINKDTEHKKEIALFLEYLLNEKNSLAFGELTGRVSPKIMADNDPAKSKPELSGFLVALGSDYAQPSIAGYSEIHDINGEAYQNVFTGVMTVEEAAAKAQKRAQAICDKANR